MSNRKNKKSQSGFTLVEVIVVAVIVAILAGVSIPLYLGYMNSSRANAAANSAGSGASFAAACVNGQKFFTLAKDTETKPGDANGSVRLACTKTEGSTDTVASLVIPIDIVLINVGGTAIKGFNKIGGDTSQPYVFSNK